MSKTPKFCDFCRSYLIAWSENLKTWTSCQPTFHSSFQLRIAQWCTGTMVSEYFTLIMFQVFWTGKIIKKYLDVFLGSMSDVAVGFGITFILLPCLIFFGVRLNFPFLHYKKDGKHVCTGAKISTFCTFQAAWPHCSSTGRKGSHLWRTLLRLRTLLRSKLISKRSHQRQKIWRWVISKHPDSFFPCI